MNEETFNMGGRKGADILAHALNMPTRTLIESTDLIATRNQALAGANKIVLGNTSLKHVGFNSHQIPKPVARAFTEMWTRDACGMGA